MKEKYIPDLIMAAIYKNHDNDSKSFIRRSPDDYYIRSEEDVKLISLQELRDTLEDIFGE